MRRNGVVPVMLGVPLLLELGGSAAGLLVDAATGGNTTSSIQLTLSDASAAPVNVIEAVVPEPGTFALPVSAGAVLAALRRRTAH
jgi:hypothetical protein